MDDNALLQAIKAAVREEVAPINNRLDTMQDDIADIKNRVTTIEVVQENKVFKSIQLLAEGHSGLVDKLELLEDVPERIEDIQNTVSVLKSVFTEHVKG